jgi:hypothetical protein
MCYIFPYQNPLTLQVVKMNVYICKEHYQIPAEFAVFTLEAR